jgi:hypothetical protein
MKWQPIEKAPKKDIHETEYLLGFVPDEAAVNRKSCIQVIWWEPNYGQGGKWWCDGDYAVHPTRWMPLPDPPEEGE